MVRANRMLFSTRDSCEIWMPERCARICHALHCVSGSKETNQIYSMDYPRTVFVGRCYWLVNKTLAQMFSESPLIGGLYTIARNSVVV